MSCLLPHFNTFTTPIPIPPHRHHHIILQSNILSPHFYIYSSISLTHAFILFAVKLRRNFYLRPHCILSPSAPSTALLEFDKFDAVNTPWPYVTTQVILILIASF